MGFVTGLLSGGKSKTTQPAAVSGLQLQSSTQGLPVQVAFGATLVAPNLVWYGDFVATQQQSSAGAGGKGGGGGGGGGKGGGSSGSYVYQTAVAMGLCEGPIQGVGAVYANKQVTDLGALGLSLFTGSYSQAPWGYLTTNHPGQALNYHGLAYAAAAAYQLGDSPQLPNHTVEVFGLLHATAPNGADADPSQVIARLLTDPNFGCGFPAARLGSLAAYQGYALATGLWVSPAYNTQAAASSLLTDLATATNAEYVWSQGLLTLVPYGDRAVNNNGYSYTPPSAPVYDLTDDDFLPNTYGPAQGSDPVQVTRKRPADAINSVKVECLDRGNQYNSALVEAKDEALIFTYGLRAAPTKQLHLFCDVGAATTSAHLQLGRQAVRNQYSFALDQRYIDLDPMDLVTLTDAYLGLSKQWVRVLEITEQDDGALVFVAEESLAGTGSPPLAAFQENSGYTTDYNTPPGNANPPAIFEPPVQISQTGGLEADIACSGGANWGGCDVWISADGNTYKLAGQVKGPARQGVLAAPLAAGTDPDTANTLAVDLSRSGGQLLSGTQADADGFHTLCYVDGEYISYETATLTGANKYSLSYLRRGGFGSTITPHAAGAPVVRLDGGVFAYAYDKGKIGQTVYVKLASFNVFGGGLQGLAAVPAYTHVLTGPPLPQAVANFQVTQNGNSVVFSWTDLVTDAALKGYDIGYGDPGSAWADKVLLTEAHRGTEMTNADVPRGNWEFSIRGHDIADQLGAEAKVTFAVASPNALIAAAAQNPGWAGTLAGLVAHPSGVLVPDNLYTMSHYTDSTPFDQFVPDPVASASFTAPVIDVGYTSNLRVYDSQGSALGPGQTGAAAALQFAVDAWADGTPDPGTFTPWSLGYAGFRYLKAQLQYTGITAGNVSYLSGFGVFADVGPTVTQTGSLAAAAGGTTLTFPNAFRAAPYVTATPVGNTPLYATVTTITATTCVIHVWNTAGSDVGAAAVNWQGVGT